MTTPEVHTTDDEPTGQALTAPRPPVHAMVGFDPFQIMDRFDEEALLEEMQGRAAKALVYVVKDAGQEVVGLSKEGVDECCMALVSQGQVIREEDLQYDVQGEGEDREAFFKCKAARYGVSPQGVEVRLDQVIGVKRQPLFYEVAEPLTLDSRVPSKKFKGKTYREMLADAEGRDYLGWMADNFREEAIRDFARRLLVGETPQLQPGRQFNPHWYEHGAMKAARNARFRLIPVKVKAAVIESARAAGAVREGQMQKPATGKQQPSAQDPTAAILNTPLPGAADKWGGYGSKPLSAVPNHILQRVANWATDKAIMARDRKQEEEAQRYDGVTRNCEFVLAGRERGEFVEPPHKDGTPRQREPGED